MRWIPSYARPVDLRHAATIAVVASLGLLLPLGAIAAYALWGGMESERAWRVERLAEADPVADARAAIAAGDLRVCAVWTGGLLRVPGISEADLDRLEPTQRGLPQLRGTDAESRALDARVLAYADAYNRVVLPALERR